MKRKSTRSKIKRLEDQEIMLKKIMVLALVLMVVLPLFAGVTSASDSSVTFVEIGRNYDDHPLMKPAAIQARITPGSVVQLEYQQLGFEKPPLLINAQIEGNIATAVIPVEHTTQPGIVYRWIIKQNGRTTYSDYATLPIIDASGDPVGGTGDWKAHDIERHGGLLPSGASVPAGGGGWPHGLSASSAPITSKLMELRYLNYTPGIHTGVDFGITEKDVLAMENGTIHQVGYDANGWGNYVVIRHDGYTYYSHYAHLKSVSVQVGQSISQGTKVGVSGNTGNSGGYHLDTGFDYYESGKRIILYPFRYFMPSSSSYNSNRDFDFIQTPVRIYDSTYGTKVEVNVYPIGTSGGTTSVYIVYKPWGSSSWTTGTMTKSSSNSQIWYYWFDPALDGQTVDYYIKVMRSNTGSMYVTRPARYESADPGIYYQAKITKGSINSLSKEEQ